MMGKLRNKKTGEIVTIGQELGDDFDGVGLMLWFDHAEGSELDDHKIYGSIAELIENWEDYKPAEPLIKDEKIRKAVRAWAEANDVKKVTIEKDFSTYAFYPTDTDRVSISVWTEPSLSNLSRGKIYTIAELCGEEEE